MPLIDAVLGGGGAVRVSEKVRGDDDSVPRAAALARRGRERLQTMAVGQSACR